MAAAIHTTRPDVDGLVWMSARWNTSQAVLLFGDRVDSSDLRVEQENSRDFLIPSDREWLLPLLASVQVAALAPPPAGMSRNLR